jgi:DNA-binding winged helix-turn-helix (wHTH) protein/tetratricopeptide (TPR) repeat protein
MPATSTIYRFGRFTLNPALRVLVRDGEPVSCPRRVFDLVVYLVEQRERAVGRDELAAAVYGRVDVTDVQLGQLVLRARRALDDDGTTQHSIATVAGFGYRWFVPTQAVSTQAMSMQAVEATAEPAPVVVTLAPAAAAVAGDEPHRPAWRGWRIVVPGVLAAVVLLFGAVALWRTPAERAAPPAARAAVPAAALVLPLTASPNPDHAWVRLGGMDLVAERLRAGGLAVPPSESVLAALRTAGDDAQAQRDALAAAFGEVDAIAGDVSVDANGQWTFALRTRPRDGVPLVATATRGDPIAAAREAADMLGAILGGRPPSDPSGALDAEADWQRARAALLANETDLARRILTESARLARDPDTLALRLAQVDLREGRLDDADTAMTALVARVPAGTNDLVRARAWILRGSARSRRGDFRAAWVDFDAALAALPADAPPVERARALSGRGSSAVPSHAFDAALADMGAARSAFAAAGDAFGAARVDANLGMLELYRARPAAALDYLDAAAAGLLAFGAQHEWQIVLTAQTEAHLALLQPDAAAKVAARAWSQRDGSRDPDQRVDIALDRAHVALATGRHDEAAALLADPANDAAQGTVLRARVAALRAELALRQARWDDARALAQAALAAWPAEGGERERGPVALIELRALVALGRLDEAGALARRPAAADALPADAVWRELGRAEWLAARGDTDAAHAAFRAALAAAETAGVPATLAAVAAAAVPALIAHGRLDEARALAGRVAPWAARDYDCALVQVRVLHAAGAVDAWRAALATALALAGERVPPASLTRLPAPR